MKIIFLLVSCALFSLNLFGQSASNEETAPEKAGVEEISPARDDGSDSPGEVKTVFVTTDIPVRCLINLNSTKPASVKMNLVAVSANGFKPETILITVNYKTNENQNSVEFKISPDKTWAVGNYRVDVLIDDVKSGSQSFEIQKTAAAAETKNEKQPPPKTAKRPRKN